MRKYIYFLLLSLLFVVSIIFIGNYNIVSVDANTTATVCGPCGTMCVFRGDIHCPQLPIDFSCEIADGQCVKKIKTPVFTETCGPCGDVCMFYGDIRCPDSSTKFSCEVVRNQCVKKREASSCKKEGDLALINDTCCPGLKKIQDKLNEIAVRPMPFYLCTALCGNGICDTATENTYNCSQDCSSLPSSICKKAGQIGIIGKDTCCSGLKKQITPSPNGSPATMLCVAVEKNSSSNYPQKGSWFLKFVRPWWNMVNSEF